MGFEKWFAKCVSGKHLVYYFHLDKLRVPFFFYYDSFKYWNVSVSYEYEYLNERNSTKATFKFTVLI